MQKINRYAIFFLSLLPSPVALVIRIQLQRVKLREEKNLSNSDFLQSLVQFRFTTT